MRDCGLFMFAGQVVVVPPHTKHRIVKTLTEMLANRKDTRVRSPSHCFLCSPSCCLLSCLHFADKMWAIRCIVFCSYITLSSCWKSRDFRCCHIFNESQKWRFGSDNLSVQHMRSSLVVYDQARDASSMICLLTRSSRSNTVPGHSCCSDDTNTSVSHILVVLKYIVLTLGVEFQSIWGLGCINLRCMEH